MVVINNRQWVRDDSAPNAGYEIIHYVCDALSDIASLPTFTANGIVGMGSLAFIIATGEMHILGSSGWRKAWTV